MSYENCTTGKYHDFTVVASPFSERRENTLVSEQQIERCKLCGERTAYGFDGAGRMKDSRQYFLDHIRVFAQNGTKDVEMQKAFEYCNPKAFQKFAKEAEDKQKSDDFQQLMKEKFHWAMKRALNNEGWVDKGKDGIDRSSREK